MGTIAGVATIPGREAAFHVMRESILPQIDRLHVARNLPDSGGIQDGEKFNFTQKGYCFVLDDDVLYPPDFVSKSIEHIERLGRKAVVAYGGKRFDNVPVSSFYHGASARRHMHFDHVAEDWPCHIPITAAMAWHSDTIRFTPSEWDRPYMADVWAGCEAFDKGIPVVVVPRPKLWLKPLTHLCDEGATIYARFKNDDEPQTRMINARRWSE